MSTSVPSPKDSGETVEGNVVQITDELRYVPETEARWCDARVVGLLEPSTEVPFIGINLLQADDPVEIKAAQVRLTSGQRGRFYIRRGQHRTLVQEGGAYLLAVYVPRPGHEVLAKVVIPATILDELLPDGWTEVDRDGRTEGYRQVSWSRVIEPETVEEVVR